jgi:hypothetical protein
MEKFNFLKKKEIEVKKNKKQNGARRKQTRPARAVFVTI